MFRNWSLRTKTTLAIMLLLTAVTMTTIFLFVRNQRELFIGEARNRAAIVLNTVTSAAADKLYFIDHTYLLDLTRNSAQTEGVNNIRMFDPRGMVLADSGDDTLRFSDMPDPSGLELLASAEPIYTMEAGQITVGKSIRFGSETFGAIRVSVSTTASQARLSAATAQATWLALLLVIGGGGLAWLVARSITRPFLKLTAATHAMANGDLAGRIEMDRGDEFATFAQSFNRMADTLQDRDQQTQELNRTLNERASQLEALVSELRETTLARDELTRTVRSLVNPVIPIMPGVLVMPLIGEIDGGRAAELSQALLEAVSQHRARFVILDVTGVQVFDSQFAQVLLHSAQAVGLIGATTLMSGIRPEVAQTIIQLGLDFSAIATFADLQQAFRFTLGQASAPRSR
ncbi:MAG TPA: STAS domain-containing protein [Herpetosiphonaceae bacterium]|nr:STAS domain-containing protein [Herpetosiphonaceae bacterium]